MLVLSLKVIFHSFFLNNGRYSRIESKLFEPSTKKIQYAKNQ